MSDKPSGYGTMLIGGQERPFHVGTNQGDIFSSLQHRRGEDGRKMSLQAFGEMFSIDRLKAGDLASADIRDFVYSALASGYQVDGLTPDFGHMEVGYWMDDADAREVGKPLNEMLSQIVKRVEKQIERAKNASAPTPSTAKGRKSQQS